MDSTPEDALKTQDTLNALLKNIMSYLQRFDKGSDDESFNHSYTRIDELVEAISIAFEALAFKIDEKLLSENDGDHYDDLEKTMQKYEGEIRTHIRIEQQLKLYAESIQSKLDDSEKSRDELLSSTKSMINAVKRDNQKLAETLKQMKEENEKLSHKVKDLESVAKKYEDKLVSFPVMQERIKALEKAMKDHNYGSTMSTMNHNLNAVGVDFENINSHQKHYEVINPRADQSSQPYQRLGSPLRLTNSKITPSGTMRSSSKASSNTDYLKVKIEISEGKRSTDKITYPKIENTPEKNPREQRSGSVPKTRDLKSIYKVQPSQNSSNNSLTNGQSSSYSQVTMSGLQQRSRSIGGPSKSRTSISNKEVKYLRCTLGTKSIQIGS